MEVTEPFCSYLGAGKKVDEAVSDFGVGVDRRFVGFEGGLEISESRLGACGSPTSTSIQQDQHSTLPAMSLQPGR